MSNSFIHSKSRMTVDQQYTADNCYLKGKYAYYVQRAGTTEAIDLWTLYNRNNMKGR